ncbi:MAG: outer membrane beta-barrel domain-containing protein [Bdellovibrionota bacterium]
MKKQIIFIALAFAALAVQAQAANVSSDMESLGSNKDIVNRANRLESRSRIAIVQNRAVDRRMRLELGLSYAPVATGDSYLRTQVGGLHADFHIVPQFSLGIRASQYGNMLTSEGKNQFQLAQDAKARGSVDYRVPDIDYPVSSIIGVATWYMMYGKMNLFDVKTVQFDIYSLAGAGTQTLSSGDTATYTAGAGIGFWLNNHLSARFEGRWQGYQDKVFTGTRDLNLMIANMGIGVLL